MSTRNELIADLMMGAAYADKRLDGREVDEVKRLLAGIMEVDAIGDEMTERIATFNHQEFDPVKVVRALGLSDDEEKRHLVEMIAAVTEADEEVDLDESEYLEKVAEALEMPRTTFTDLTVEVLEVENLKQAAKKLIQPPPIPAAARK